MYLLSTKTGRLHQFSGPRSLPAGDRYAILSHVWSESGEQTYQELKALIESGVSLRKASPKVRAFCKFARAHGYRWVWIDSCCIDKTSSAELSEAINAMYSWYAAAHVCYAYLADVSDEEDPREPNSGFRRSKWFTRGWTLQELIAPRFLVFLSKKWTVIGTKATLAQVVAEITGVAREILIFAKRLEDASVAQRMSWAAARETTRLEDEAYSLMGIFGVYMPTIYGEGSNAFVRLQQEILKRVPDQSLFAWGKPTCILGSLEHHVGSPFSLFGGDGYSQPLFARRPSDFANSSHIRAIPQARFIEKMGGMSIPLSEYTSTSHGVRVCLPLASLRNSTSNYLAFLPCEDHDGRLLALVLHPKRNGSPGQFCVSHPRIVYVNLELVGRTRWCHTSGLGGCFHTLARAVGRGDHIEPRMIVVYIRPDEEVDTGVDRPIQRQPPFSSPLRLIFPVWAARKLKKSGIVVDGVEAGKVSPLNRHDPLSVILRDGQGTVVAEVRLDLCLPTGALRVFVTSQGSADGDSEMATLETSSTTPLWPRTMHGLDRQSCISGRSKTSCYVDHRACEAKQVRYWNDGQKEFGVGDRVLKVSFFPWDDDETSVCGRLFAWAIELRRA